MPSSASSSDNRARPDAIERRNSPAASVGIRRRLAHRLRKSPGSRRRAGVVVDAMAAPVHWIYAEHHTRFRIDRGTGHVGYAPEQAGGVEIESAIGERETGTERSHQCRLAGADVDSVEVLVARGADAVDAIVARGQPGDLRAERALAPTSVATPVAVLIRYRLRRLSELAYRSPAQSKVRPKSKLEVRARPVLPSRPSTGHRDAGVLVDSDQGLAGVVDAIQDALGTHRQALDIGVRRTGLGGANVAHLDG